MRTILMEELFLVTLVLVDDGYQQKGQYLLQRTVGDKPVFSDSEMLTLMLALDFFEFTSERRYHAFIAANYRALFPHLLDQSQYNRRARRLRYLLNELRKAWVTPGKTIFCWIRPRSSLSATAGIKATAIFAARPIMGIAPLAV